MDLDRMLDKCHRHQWSVGDLDWSREPPQDLEPDVERAIVQYFTDMAAIERLAGALFAEQGRRTNNPVLAEIFETFVKDELRHSHVAQMLADHYDVHRLEHYQVNPALARFAPRFIEAVRYVSAEMATVYITTGELILDVALLRSLNDYVDDPMAAEAMERINQDESRHIAIDFHMIEQYAKLAEQDAPPERLGLRDRVRAARAFAGVFRHARPFFQDVFFAPMERCDPSGKRIKEAFKRIQLLGAKPEVAARPFPRFAFALQGLHNHPVAGPVLGRITVRVLGVDSEVLRELTTERERAEAVRKSYDELAQEAIGLKYA